MARDFYAVLALPRNASEDQIRQRFRELARTRHPDRFQGEEKARAEVEFQELTQAFNVLADPERRRRHDVELARPEEAASASDPRQAFRAYLQRGVKAYKEKNFLEAASNFDQATQADPKSGQAWHHLAQACSQQKTWFPRAVAAIERACHLEPMNVTYLKQAGRICALAGQTDQAIEYYRKAIQWGGDDPAVRQALEELTRSSSSPSRWGLFGKTG
ncbi:MAG TPA: DnaJ domain-containing protein [Thermoanaerobaculia bacterium]|jgi:DnaJ-class molecular chaperone|nr:DnaJ domain-containing protein [Thermoanaerobaculia bacterium]